MAEVTTVELPFKEQFKRVKTGFENCLKLQEGIISSPSHTVKIDDNTTISKKDFNRYKAILMKDFDKLLAAYNRDTKKGKKKKKLAEGAENNGNARNPMFAPIYVNDQIINYFKSIDLGAAYKLVGQQGEEQIFSQCNTDLRKCLTLLLTKGVTSCATLTPLFILVTKLYELQDSENAQFVIPDNHFNQHFGAIFQSVLREQNEEIKQLKLNRANASPEEQAAIDAEIETLTSKLLDPQKFRLVRFQTIVSKCKIKVSTPEQKQYLEDPTVIEKLREEQRIVSNTLKHFKSVPKEEETK